MIKYIEDIPGNIDNLATLMLTNVDEDKTILKQNLTESLNKLRQERLIQKNGDNYIFLTDEEQDINREIQGISIDDMKVIDELSQYLFEEIYPQKKFSYSNNYNFDFNEIFDKVKHGKQTASINLSILSSLPGYDLEDAELQMQTMQSPDLIVQLGGDSSYIEEIREALKIEKYRRRRNINDLSETKQNILNNKQAEVRERRNRVKNLLETAIKEATYYANGQKLTIKGSSARDRINSGLSYLVENVYTKLSLVKDHIDSEKDLKLKITSNDTGFLPSIYPNILAMDEIERYINLQTKMSKQITVKLIYDNFEKIPFGWKPLDIAGMLIDLLKSEKIRLRYNTIYLNTQESQKELMHVLTNNIESGKCIILKREKVDTELISKVKLISRDLFDTVNLPEDEDGMISSIQDLINNKKDKIREYKQKNPNKIYPGFSLLEKGIELFDNFSNRLDNITYFNKLIELKDDLIQWDDDFNVVIDFFESNQKKLFDDGLNILKRYEQNQLFFENEPNEIIEESVTNIRNILKNPIPYSEIKYIPELVETFNQTFKEILENRKNKTKEKLQEDFESIKIYSNQDGVTEETKENINKTWEDYFKQTEANNDIHLLDALTGYSSKAKDKFKEIIDREVNPPSPGPVIPIKRVKVKDLVLMSRLKSEEDVDSYIEQLSKGLKKIIHNNSHIEIVD